MKPIELVASLLALGVALWLASRVVDSQPWYAAVTVLAALVSRR